MRTLIRNGRLVCPEETVAGALLMEEGVISGLFGEGEDLPRADEVVDAGGRMVLPGFVDIHAHGADGADVCDGEMEALLHIAEMKVREGVTTWLPTTLTLPEGRLREVAAACAETMAHGAACRIPGIHLEGPFIEPEMAGAQNPEFARLPSGRELRALHGIVPVRILSLAPELRGGTGLIREAVEMGVVCSAAHTRACYAEVKAAMGAGLRHLTHFGNAMTPLHHREIGVVGAGLLEDGLNLEVICDGVHLSEEMLRLIFQRVAVERILMITDSVAASWRGEGEMKLGGLDVVVGNGEARLKGSGALAGSTLRFNEGLAKVVAATGLPVEKVARATSWNQARALGLEGTGALEPGYAGDVVMLEDDFSVRGTWVGGKRVC